MKDHENLYDKIREILGHDPNHVNILEDNIDVDLQVEYFEFSKRLAQEYDEGWALGQAGFLDDPEYSLDNKKNLLARLATMEDVTAYRAIESYMNNPDEELRDWGLLALQESRMHIESHLLEENQVFISTGLGGRGNRLRYFVVLIGRDRTDLSAFEKQIIEKEFSFCINNYEGEVEEFKSSGYLATFLLLLPIQHSVNKVFLQGIKECNQFGDFLTDDCIVTNVRKLSFEEITGFIEKKIQE
ncbi:MAG: hypothetical protein K9J30_12335 [Bacteroidales bacterium]|nr:hypothetical protein [Bacteroidales bacterium]